MAVTLKECWDSQKVKFGVNGRSDVVRLNSKGSDNADEIFAAVLAIASGQPGGPLWEGFIRQDVSIDIYGGGRALVEVEYGIVGFGGTDNPVGSTIPDNPSPPGGGSSTDQDAPLGPGYTLNISSETVHITQSRKTISTITLVGGEAAPDTKQAIGLTTDKVEGCDVWGPKTEWNRKVLLPQVTMRYIMALEDLVGKKNAASFYGRNAGEQLFLGATGEPAGFGNAWNVTFQFATKRNRTNVFLVRNPTDPNNVNAPGALVIPSLRGWDYVWVGYKKQIANDKVAPTPYFAKIEEVVEDGDFSLIGIGQ